MMLQYRASELYKMDRRKMINDKSVKIFKD